MKENFPLALGFVLKHEGGYVNDPDDPGGETNRGISKRFHPNEDIKGMTDRRAGEIYHQEYWLPTCDILSFPKDVIYFDQAVNMGRAAATNTLAESGAWEDMLFRRIKLYVEKVLLKPVKLKFFFGWLSRCLALYRLVKDEQRRVRK